MGEEVRERLFPKHLWYTGRHTFVCLSYYNKRREKNQQGKEKNPPHSCTFLQGAGPTGKNEEKIQVLTDKIDVLLQQVRIFNSTIREISCFCYLIKN